MSSIQLVLLTAALIFHISGVVASSGDSDWYYKNWCGGSLQYLDDSLCSKKFPLTSKVSSLKSETVLDSSDQSSFVCDVALSDEAPEADSGFVLNGDFSKILVDVESLDPIVTDTDINLCVIVTKRVSRHKGLQPKLYNKYLCAGSRSANVAFETWSSSKIFAMVNAAGHLRSNESSEVCGGQHSSFGLDGSVTGKKGVTPLGDLATIVCSYDHTAGYTSNSLSSYFHDIGWRDRINWLLTDWLGVSGQTLGGNYGEATPSDLTYKVSASSPTVSDTCTAAKDPWPKVYDNTISSLTAAELARRIAQYREMPLSMRYPGTEWADIKTILYGSGSESQLFPGQLWGGMTADTAIFLQAALQNLTITDTEPVLDGDGWRIFSKLGAGYSTLRSRGEIVTTAYACIPRRYLSNGTLSVSGGLEFTLSSRGSVPYDSSLHAVEKKLLNAVNRAMQYLFDTF